MQKFSFVYICVLAVFIVIEAKPWCGLNGCDSGEQDEDDRFDVTNEHVSSKSNEDRPDQDRHSLDRYGQGVYGPDGHVPVGHDQGVYSPDRYVSVRHGQSIYVPGEPVQGIYDPVRYVPGGHVQGIFVPGGHVQGIYGPGVYVPGGHIQGIYGPGVYDRHRGDESFVTDFPRRQYPPYYGKQGRFTIDISFQGGNNGHSSGGVGGDGNVSGGPCRIGSNGRCVERRPPYPNKNDVGTNYAMIPEDCPHCKIRSFGYGENNHNTFNLPSEAYN